jgi:hypothetical protein
MEIRELKYGLAVAALFVAQSAMAESLGDVGLERYEEDTKRLPSRAVVSLGSYGSNLVFNSVGQEKPAILVYLNDQRRAYDREFPDVLERLITNTGDAFGALPLEERQKRMERMSRMSTPLHEFGHGSLPDGSPEADRLGAQAVVTIDEAKAEILSTALLPSIIEKGGVDGTKEQWAVASLASNLQMLRDQPEGNDYYYATVYKLNSVMESGAIRFENGKLTITDTENYYESMRKAASELKDLYETPSTTQAKAKRWIRERCRPNEKLAEVETFLKKQAEAEG